MPGQSVDDLVAELLDAPRASVLAAAGCGKTELIAKTVAADPDGRHLVLTHTHAGVHALQARLRRFDVAAKRAPVSTIGAFALRFAASFPQTCGLPTSTPSKNAEWRGVYEAATQLLATSVLARIVRASYSSVLVDEYQDCTLVQHELVRGLAAVVPVRVFGDPVQGLFDFAEDGLVDWSRDVDGELERLAEIETPYRWRNTNPALGEWLASARHALVAGQPLPDPGDVVTRGASDRQEQLRVCRQTSQEREVRVVAIHGHPNQAHALAKNLKGLYSSMEEMACHDLMQAAATIDAAEGPDRSLAVMDFLKQCTSNTGQSLSSARARYARGQTATARATSSHKPAVNALNEVAEAGTPDIVLNAIDAILELPGVRVHRRELLREMRRALRHQQHHPEADLTDAAWHVRDITRRTGRRMPRLAVGRTHLVKGLEFQRAIVLDASALGTPQQLYVAITRGAYSLSLLGEPRHFPPAL